MESTAASPSTSIRPRQSILGFMGRRKRASTVANAPNTIASNASTSGRLSPVDSPPSDHSSSAAVREQLSAADAPITTRSTSNPVNPPARLSRGQDEAINVLTAAVDSSLIAIGLAPPSSASRKNRDTSRDATSNSRGARSPLRPAPSTTANPPSGSPIATTPAVPVPKHHKLRLVPCLNLSGRPPSLQFEPVVRILKIGKHGITIGRYLDPTATGLGTELFELETMALMGSSRVEDKKSSKVTFKSKVVSRTHAHMWVDETGQFWIRDTKSSSGTFVNHARLSPPGQESAPHVINDGDIIQLGVDYQGGRDEIYRCVRLKVEVGRGREWQGGANVFKYGHFSVVNFYGTLTLDSSPHSTAALQLIRSLRAANATQHVKANAPIATVAGPDASMPSRSTNPKKAHAGAGDCAIYTDDTESLLGLDDVLNEDSGGDAEPRSSVARSPSDAGSSDGAVKPKWDREEVRREMLIGMEEEDFRRAVEASRRDVMTNARYSSTSLGSPETPEPEVALAIRNSGVTTPVDTAREGPLIASATTTSTSSRGLLAIDTAFNSSRIPHGEVFQYLPRDLLKTAVNPNSTNPFHAYGGGSGDVTPVMTPLTSPLTYQSRLFDRNMEGSSATSDLTRGPFGGTLRMTAAYGGVSTLVITPPEGSPKAREESFLGNERKSFGGDSAGTKHHCVADPAVGIVNMSTERLEDVVRQLGMVEEGVQEISGTGIRHEGDGF
ncbi:hypothetical protein FRB98_004752 [Tulasnella sp. 332]|nr:hypothetical protein FRB98_004752 [Tulasnella sp. 332]